MGERTMEDVYGLLAAGIDRHGRDKEAMFLSKVALLLAQEIGDAARVCTLIEQAQNNMEGMRKNAKG